MNVEDIGVDVYMNKIACVVLNYNDAINTVELIHQIEKYNTIDHIIVVDNCSTDDSMQKLTELVSDKVSVHVSPQNGGYGFGNNYGIKIAYTIFKCAYAFVVSPDVRFEEKTLLGILKCFENDSNCKAATAVQIYDNKLNKETAWYLPTKTQYILSVLTVLGKIFHINQTPIINVDQPYVTTDCIMGSFLCVDCKAFLAVGGFDENIFLNCEEVALGFRYKEAGYKMKVDTNDVYYHYHETGPLRKINSEANIFKMILNNRLYILNSYMHASKPTILFTKACYKLAIAEKYCKAIIKNLI